MAQTPEGTCRIPIGGRLIYQGDCDLLKVTIRKVERK